MLRLRRDLITLQIALKISFQLGLAPMMKLVNSGSKVFRNQRVSVLNSLILARFSVNKRSNVLSPR